MVRLLVHLVRAIASVAWRRIRRSPTHPAWSFGFEVLVDAMRLHARWIAGLPVDAQRRAMAALKGRVAPGVTVERGAIAGVPTTTFRPPSAAPDRVLLYVHGGGHVTGSADQDRGIAALLAATTEAVVVAPDFRLAPEAPCPAEIEDVIAVFRASCQEGRTPVVVGLSSGAGTAVALATTLRDERAPMPRALVLLSPLLDARLASASWSTNRRWDWGEPDAIAKWCRLFAGDRDLSDALVSPLHASLEGLPPMLIVVGELEIGRDDAAAFGERARAAGVDVAVHVAPAMVHAYMTFGRDDEPTREALSLVNGFVVSRGSVKAP